MTTPKVLICVLDWGLGHATRSLALVRTLQEHGIPFAIASSGKALALLKLELPAARFYDLPSYGVNYSNSSFTLGIVFQIPRMLRVIEQERIVLETIVSKEKPDVIISDCRYGCYHPNVRSIFLSHQLQIQLTGGWRVFRGLVNYYHHRLIKRFSERWVPDYPDRSMSGDLSKSTMPITFIGPLSTMKRPKQKAIKKLDVLAVLSGPEPQRSIFAGILDAQLKNFQGEWLMVHGLPDNTTPDDERHISFMTRDSLNEAMNSADVIIARSGYSTVMDVAALNKRAVLIPTPGQTEQIYLANRLMENRIAFSQEQDSIILTTALNEVKSYQGFPQTNGQHHLLLNKAVKSLQTV